MQRTNNVLCIAAASRARAAKHQGLTMTADYWNIALKDKIAALPEQTIFGNFEKYRAN